MMSEAQTIAGKLGVAPDADAATRTAFVRYQREAATPQTARAMLALAYDIDQISDGFLKGALKHAAEEHARLLETITYELASRIESGPRRARLMR